MSRFLRNCWYAAAISTELDKGPIERRLLNEDVCLYRGEDGRSRAVRNLCPHRFAALSEGRVIGNDIQCPYHGLQFNGEGACTLNPHGNGVIPNGAKVAAWPVVEQHGMVWIWMGDPDRADPAEIKHFTLLDRTERYDFSYIYMHSQGNYQLVVDNLLDLSHVTYLHPFLTAANPGRMEFEMEAQENAIVSTYTWHDGDLPGIFNAVWPGAVPTVDSLAEMTWRPPAFCFGNMAVRPAGDAEWADASHIPNIHMITPETDTTSHYFWVGGYNKACYTSELSDQYRETSYRIFTTEDMPVINRIQRNMGTDDLMSLKPILLSVDGAAVRARRMLQRLIEEEANEREAGA